jgi:GNAT superfamily N-acetyltransferase
MVDLRMNLPLLIAMETNIKLSEITIRTDLRPGDIGYVTYLHGIQYNREHNFGIAFESYVASGLHDFYQQYDTEKDCVWVCEHEGTIVGFLVLMHRPGNAAQLRYFIVLPAYRGFGLGRKLMNLFMDFFHAKGYRSAFLWTTSGLPAAAHLYKSVGFVLTEELDSTAFGIALKEQRYELTLA